MIKLHLLHCVHVLLPLLLIKFISQDNLQAIFLPLVERLCAVPPFGEQTRLIEFQ